MSAQLVPTMSSLPTLLLATGACFSQDGSFERCALQPSECGSDKKYRSSHQLSLTNPDISLKCSDQAHIHTVPALGRCDSKSERFICTSHKTACINDFAFKPSDPDCTVLNDFRPVDTKFVRSYYGECVPTDAGEDLGFPRYAAWQFTECPAGGDYTGTYSFRTADRFWASQLPELQCDQVKTGACVSDADPSQFFCAVTPEVCASEDGFSYLKSYQVEWQLAKTCKLCDAVAPSPKVLFAKAGACLDSSSKDFVRCALIPGHCDGPGEEFYGPLEVSKLAFDPPATICLEQTGLKQVRLGRCDAVADQYVCTSHATACRNTISFRPNDDECGLVEDTNNDRRATSHFPHCSSGEWAQILTYEDGRENYCAWAFSECKPATEDDNARPLTFGGAVPGNSGTYPNCHCDDVRTGGCVSDASRTDVYCAVEESVCAPGYTYHNVRSLELASGSNTICYLCEELTDLPMLPDTNADTVSNARPVSQPTRNWNPPPVTRPTTPPISNPPPTSRPTTSSFRTPSDSSQQKEKQRPSALSQGTILGIAVGVVLAMAFMVVVVHYYCSRESPTPRPSEAVDKVLHEKDPRKMRAQEEAGGDGDKPMEPGQAQEDFLKPDHSIN